MTFRTSKRAAALLAKRRISKLLIESVSKNDNEYNLVGKVELKESVKIPLKLKRSDSKKEPDGDPAEKNLLPIGTNKVKSNLTGRKGSHSIDSMAKNEHYRRRAERMVHSERPMLLSRRTSYKMQRTSIHSPVPSYSPLAACKLSFQSFDRVNVSSRSWQF